MKLLLCQTEVPVTKELLEQLYPSECKRYMQMEKATKSLKALVSLVSARLESDQETTHTGP